MSIRPLVLVFALLASPIAAGSLFSYPDDKTPDLKLSKAFGIAGQFLDKHRTGERYSIQTISLLGDEEQSGAGTWTLIYHNTDGDRVQITLYFPEDDCLVITMPKKGASTQKGYTRDGKLSKKWLEWEAIIKREAEAHERVSAKDTKQHGDERSDDR